jgi:hypothetical protein
MASLDELVIPVRDISHVKILFLSAKETFFPFPYLLGL